MFKDHICRALCQTSTTAREAAGPPSVNIWTACVAGLIFLFLSGKPPSLRAAEPSAHFIKHVIDPAFPSLGVAAMDVDGDGKLDIVAAGGPGGAPSEWSNLVNWYQAPSWEKHSVCALKQGTNKQELVVILHMEAVDFSTRKPSPAALKRPPEITIADGRQGHVWWYRYDRQTKTWSGHLIADNVQGVHGTASGDIDGDGYHDILIPTSRGTPPRGMMWIRNPGPGPAQTNLWPRHLIAGKMSLPSSQHYVRLADINGDGKLDALHGSSGGKEGWMGYWLQGRNPQTEWDLHVLSGPMRRATNLDATDLNGDGRMDLVGTEGHGTGVWYFLAPEFQAKPLDAELKSTHSLALGDFTGNGAPDIATCGYESKQVALFLNNGKSGFTRIMIDTNQCAYDAAAVDLDGDGNLDLLLAGQHSGNVVWYENKR